MSESTDLHLNAQLRNISGISGTLYRSYFVDSQYKNWMVLGGLFIFRFRCNYCIPYQNIPEFFCHHLYSDEEKGGKNGSIDYR